MATVGAGRPGSSSEYALLKTYYVLVTVITQSPGDIVDRMIQFSIFSSGQLDSLRSGNTENRDKARTIVDTILKKVKFEPSFYYDMVDKVFKKEAWMGDCLKTLEGNLTNIPANNQVDIKDFVYVSTPTSPIEDIYTASKDNELLSTTEQLRESDLQNRTTQIKEKFGSLVTSVAMKMEARKVTAKKLLFHLRQLKSIQSDNTEAQPACLYFTKDFIDHATKNCSDVFDVLSEIENYYSWINFGLVESIIDAFLRKDDDIQEMWKDYQEQFKLYCKERVCDISKLLEEPGQHHGTSTLVFKVDCEWSTLRLDRLGNITDTIIRVLELESHTLFLKTVRKGCVEVVYEIPEHVAEHILPLDPDKIKELEQHSIRVYTFEAIPSIKITRTTSVGSRGQPKIPMSGPDQDLRPIQSLMPKLKDSGYESILSLHQQPCVGENETNTSNIEAKLTPPPSLDHQKHSL